MFTDSYASVFDGDDAWRALPATQSQTFPWQPDSTYIRLPPYFQDMPAEPAPVVDLGGMRLLALLGDSVTTDHISPAGRIAADGPAADYLRSKGVAPADFNSFGSRRGNHEG